MSFFSVFIGRAEHILLEVCPLDATRTLLGPVTTCLFCQCGRCGYEGDLRLHGRPVSQSSCVYTVSSFTCFVLNLLQLVGIHLRAIVSLSGTKRPNPKASALCSFALEVKLWLHLVREQLLLRAFCVHCFLTSGFNKWSLFWQCNVQISWSAAGLWAEGCWTPLSDW